MQERRNSSALAMELRLSCTNLLIYAIFHRQRACLIILLPNLATRLNHTCTTRKRQLFRCNNASHSGRGNVFRFSTWCHWSMKMLSALLSLNEGIHRSSVNSPPKGPVMKGFDISLSYAQHAVQQTVVLLVMWDAIRHSFDITLMSPSPVS